MTAPSERREAEPAWQCCGCGAAAPGRVKACDCPTRVVYEPSRVGKKHLTAWCMDEAEQALGRLKEAALSMAKTNWATDRKAFQSALDELNLAARAYAKQEGAQ